MGKATVRVCRSGTFLMLHMCEAPFLSLRHLKPVRSISGHLGQADPLNAVCVVKKHQLSGYP